GQSQFGAEGCMHGVAAVVCWQCQWFCTNVQRIKQRFQRNEGVTPLDEGCCIAKFDGHSIHKYDDRNGLLLGLCRLDECKCQQQACDQCNEFSLQNGSSPPNKHQTSLYEIGRINPVIQIVSSTNRFFKSGEGIMHVSRLPNRR